MPVNTPSDAYLANADKWEAVRVCVAGSKAIKDKGTKYLPMHNASDTSDANKAKYKAFKESANFVNYVSRTRNTLVGLAFNKEPEQELPQPIDYLMNDATGQGVTLEQVAKNGVGDCLETGNYFYLADYPQAEEGLSAEQVSALNLRAVIKEYAAEDVISFKTARFGALNLLSQVVLREAVEKPIDEFTSQKEYQYRVLRLRDEGYTQQVYDESDPITNEIVIRDFSGNSFEYIPGYFAGAYSNDPCIDDGPLYDIAEVNIAHYRNSAEYENSIRMIGNPQAFLAGSFWGEPPESLLFGTSTAWIMKEGGQAGLIQVAPNTIAKEGMDAKESQIVAIGARLVTPGGQAQTASAEKIRFAGDMSVLQNVVQNVSDALRKCLKDCLRFMSPSIEQDIVFDVNEQFYTETPDPQLVTQMIMLKDRGTIAEADIRKYLRDTGIIPDGRTDEMIEAEAEAVNPIG